MRKLTALLLALILTAAAAFAEAPDGETPAAAESAAGEHVKRVFVKGEIPDFAPEDVLFEIYVAKTVGSDGMVLLSDGQVMTVDATSLGQYDKLKAILDECGISRIDIAFNTHPDNDHIGGYVHVLEDHYGIGRFVTPFPDEKYPYQRPPVMQKRVIKAMRSAGVPIEGVKDGDVIDFGNAKLTVIQQTQITTNANMVSAMLMVQVGSCRLLLTADAENPAQLWYVEHGYDLKADIMKYPHHAVAKVEDDFLAAVAPEAIFVTHGYHDVKRTRMALEKTGIPFGYTSHGAIHLITDGERWIIDHQVADEQKILIERYNLAF